MEEVKKEHLEVLKIQHMLLIYLVAFVSCISGYFIYNSDFFNIILLLQFLQRYFQFVCKLTELGATAGIIPIPFVEKFIEFIWIKKASVKTPKALKRIKMVNLVLTLICIISAFMLGCSVAKNNNEQDNLLKIANDYAQEKNELYPEDFEKIIKYRYVEIKIRVSSNEPYKDISELDPVVYKNIELYVLDKLISEEIQSFDLKYLFSDIISMIKHNPYEKYELRFTLINSEKPTLDESSEAENTDISSEEDSETETTSYADISEVPAESEDVLVIIEEVLVKKDNKPLIKIKEESGISRTFIYGYDDNYSETKSIKSSENGYIIESKGKKIGFVIWNDTKKYVNEKNEVYFEDLYIDKNTPFMLNDKNLKRLFDKAGIKYDNGSLSITVYKIDEPDDLVYGTMPLDMTTEVNRILYYYRDSKNDCYFTIQTTSDGHQLFFEDEAQKNEYKLLCEIVSE